ncbi:PPE family protein [Mycolicibacterium aubagnense]|uniref:PPE family protein n=1 Tax=Mycolicibacterium aubagnense TaxID=319707 RepID=A0ABM7IFR1_9MYCO|nr:PPE family protein [Mycolicibacterium aubagnense]TLH70745.1 PPE family protein [Mycolicibacterium aubagnense]BBX85599.1 PPE family protein [Mycolicibacterium aubagnense]
MAPFLPAMPAMFYGAFPPEVNTGRLMAGAGPAPMLQAAAGWEALAIALETQAVELSASLSELSANWSGMGSERAVTATMPMVTWLHTTAIQAQKRAMQALAQAESYTVALASTPQLPEIETNHVTHAVLEGTNFLGINTVPIGFNEADYARMWALAGAVMEAYNAETTMNTLFEPILPATPIVIPGVGEATEAAIVAQAVMGVSEAVARNLVIAQVAGQSVIEDAALMVGNAASQASFAGGAAQNQASKAESAAQRASEQQDKGQQGTQMMMQVASQVGSQVAQLPQQLGQLITQPVQQLSQPMQQVTQIFSQLGSSFGQNNGPQIGLMGASPFSNHPLAGGSGATSGAGLVRAASLPGMGGSAPRTPLMASLVGSLEGPSTASLEAGAAAGASGAGKAPVSSAGGAGTGMGPGGKAEKGGGTREALKAPGVLVQDLDDDDDDW